MDEIETTTTQINVTDRKKDIQFEIFKGKEEYRGVLDAKHRIEIILMMAPQFI